MSGIQQPAKGNLPGFILDRYDENQTSPDEPGDLPAME